MLSQTNEALLALNAALFAEYEAFVQRNADLQDQLARSLAELKKNHEIMMYKGRSQLYPELSLRAPGPTYLIVEKDPPLSGCPIDTLPPEILSQIFQDFTDENYNPLSRLIPEKLVKVCRRWRDVCIATPQCWAFIEIEHDYALGDKTSFISRVPSTTHHIQRSGNQPLRILVVMEGDDRQEIVEDVLACIKIAVGHNGCHMARWQDVKLCISHWDGNRFLQTFSYPTPKLKHLEIDGILEPGELVLAETFTQVPNGLTVEANFAAEWDLGDVIYSATETLVVGGGEFEDIYLRLPSFSSLTKLVLSFVADDDNEFIDSGPEDLTLESLRVLVISSPDWEPFINCLELPELAEIIILRPHNEDGLFDKGEMVDLLDVLSRFLPQIETLEVTYTELDEQDWVYMLVDAEKLVRRESTD